MPTGGAWPLPVQAPADPGDVALSDEPRQLTLNGATRPRQISGLDKRTQRCALDPFADKLSRNHGSLTGLDSTCLLRAGPGGGGWVVLPLSGSAAVRQCEQVDACRYQ